MALATGITYPNNGDRIKVENYNTSIQKIVAQLNGNLDDANIISLSGTKLTAGTVPLTALNTAATTSLAQGWNTLSNNPNTVTYLGNRSYSLVFNAVDLTSTISPGYRLRTTRTVASPTQCTSLNGTTQFYSKTSPAGMTFTNNFVVSAWVKLTSYTSANDMIIASRYNGTSGWDFGAISTGQIFLRGYNAGTANNSFVLSYQSIPLNRWVHVSAQLDMATFTASPTTSYVMLDGVDVPASVARSGTNPTALVQAGNLEIGSENAGLKPFPGKIAQAAIFNAKVTQATMQGYISQGLLGTETSLISAYSFNNTINDLNTTNANNLTANGSAVATNTDSPFGTQAGGLISSTLDYGIVQSNTFSTNTTMVVQVPEGCTIPTSGGVTTTSYSNTKAPYGMPVEKFRYAIIAFCSGLSSINTSSPVVGTVYEVPGLRNTLPIGKWAPYYDATAIAQRTGAGVAASLFTLSSSTSSFTDSDMTAEIYMEASTGANVTTIANITRRKINLVSISAATPYYFIYKTLSAGQVTIGLYHNDSAMSKVIFDNEYV